MAITDAFVLAEGVVLLPVRDLPGEVRRGLPGGDDEFAVGRPGSRVTAKMVDSSGAELIRQFAEPKTIAQAVARYSRGRSEDPERLLEEGLPLLQSLIAAGLLVPPGSEGTRRVLPSLAPGETMKGWRVVRCVQHMEDTELYLVRGPGAELAALKMGRAAKHEAGILSGIAGDFTPRVLQTGERKRQPYLLMEWHPGVDALTASEDYGKGISSGRIGLAGAILESYAKLHEQGFIHGDVHPRNILVDRRGSIRLIDFGYGRRLDDPLGNAPPERAGVGFFLEPELARAFARRAAPPSAGPAGEQYAVAVLLYLILTGANYLDFSLERGEMMRQIAEDRMLPFSRHGGVPWPAMEAVLGKALSKEPADRFPSMREFHNVWSAAVRSSPYQDSPPIAVTGPSEERSLKALRSRLMEDIGLGGPLLGGGPLPPPAASINFGSAGIAYGLYRQACASDSAELLALADVWSVRAVREIAHDAAFYNQDLDVTPETVGRQSLFHSAVGIHAVQALIAQARGDVAAHSIAANAFLRAVGEFDEKTGFDVTLGRAGILLACESLLGMMPFDGRVPQEIRGSLLGKGRSILQEIWKRLDSYSPIPESHELSNLGIAHGWAGMLYATLRWCASTGDPLSPGLYERLDQLARCAEPAGRGMQWKWDLARSEAEPGGVYAPGWCNGSAGYVYLWTLAHRVLGEPAYLDLAEGAAWNAWETKHPIGNLCCGIAGQAYALLNLYRHTGEGVWLRRARELSRLAATASGDRAESLYKGALGVIVLDCDLNQPEYARMPMFESEADSAQK